MRKLFAGPTIRFTTPSELESGPAPDAVVVGAGPAGLALAAAIAELGAAVVVVDPAPGRPWLPHYGAWLADLEGAVGASAGRFVARSFDHPLVVAQGRATALAQTYVQVDKGALRRHLVARLEAAGGRWVEGAVARITHGATASRCFLRDGRWVEGRVVVDASGAATRHVQRRGEARSWQIAHGVELEVAHHPWAPGQMVLMDWEGAHLTAEERRRPSFLYALPRSADRVFVEETQLATRWPQSLTRLADRLERRLHAMGLEVRHRGEVERCVIPLDLPRPVPGQRVVAYGAAASMVHPVSGYQLTAALGQAHGVASALCSSLAEGPAAAACAASEAIARPSASAQVLLELGHDMLCGLDQAGANAFFATLFAAGDGPAHAWLGADSGPVALTGAMAAMFAAAPWRQRRKLVSHAASFGATRLASHVRDLSSPAGAAADTSWRNG